MITKRLKEGLLVPAKAAAAEEEDDGPSTKAHSSNQAWELAQDKAERIKRLEHQPSSARVDRLKTQQQDAERDLVDNLFSELDLSCAPRSVSHTRAKLQRGSATSTMKAEERASGNISPVLSMTLGDREQLALEIGTAFGGGSFAMREYEARSVLDRHLGTPPSSRPSIEVISRQQSLTTQQPPLASAMRRVDGGTSGSGGSAGGMRSVGFDLPGEREPSTSSTSASTPTAAAPLVSPLAPSTASTPPPPPPPPPPSMPTPSFTPPTVLDRSRALGTASKLSSVPSKHDRYSRLVSNSSSGEGEGKK